MGNGKEYCVPCKFNKENARDSSFSLFKFPSSPSRRRTWINNLELPEVKLGKNTKVCGGHFTRDQFVRTKLKKDAIPSSSSVIPKPIEGTPTPRNLIPIRPKSEHTTIVYPSPLQPVVVNINVLHQVNVIYETPAPPSKVSHSSCKRRLSRSNDRVKRLKLSNSNQVELGEVFEGNPGFLQFIRQQVFRYKCMQTPYTSFEKSVGLSLFYSCGRKGYTSLINFGLMLPALNTIRGWMNGVRFLPVINHQLLDMVQKQTAELKLIDKDCVLMWDEMSIKELMQYNKSLDMFEGIIDHGEFGRELETANEVLVFMVQSIHSNWRFPISFYFSKNSTTADLLEKMVEENIAAVTKIGLKIRVGVCDMSFCNQSLYKKMGISVNQPYKYFQNQKIYFMHEPPHLIKLIRNNLMKHDMTYVDVCSTEGNTRKWAKWSHVKSFFVKDRRVPSRMAPRLTNLHIFLKDYAKMKVKLAVQTLSHSVASGMTADLNLLNPAVKETAKFIKIVDEIFDILNISKFTESKYKQSAKYFSDHLKCIDPYLDFLKSIRIPSTARNPEFLYGLILTLTVIKNLAYDLKHEGYTYLLTRRIQQDPLENFFSAIRMKGGFCLNPTAFQFRCNFRYLVFTRLMKMFSNSHNTESDEGDFFQNVEETLSRFPVQKGQKEPTPNSNDDHLRNKKAASQFYSVKLNPKLKLAKEQENLVAGYIGGASVRAIFLFRNCYDCREHVSLNSNPELNHEFIKLKEFCDDSEELIYLNDFTQKMFEFVNVNFVNCAVTSLSVGGTNILNNIYSKLMCSEIVKNWVDNGICRDTNHREEMIKYFLRSKLFRMVKDKNDSLRKPKSWDQSSRELRNQ